MKRLSLLVALLGLLVPAMFVSAVSAASASATIFTASLNGGSSVPPVNTIGTGDAQVVINAAGTAVTYTVSYVNLSGPVVAAHIHAGAINANGPVSLPFTVGPSPMHGTLTAANFVATPQAPTFNSIVNLIRTGGAYVNVHTALHPGGEIRGQLTPSKSLQFFGGTFSGGAEVPGVSGAGTGTVQLLVDTQGYSIHYAITYSGLSGDVVAAHIHFGDPSISGPIMIPFKVGPSPMVGILTQANFQSTPQAPTWADAIAAIRSGHAYANLHTAAHPSGEVRSNLVP
jgi:hypothetical protein